MIDLELVDALLDALPAGAPLVLIGDAHQLPAIDAGQILADLADPDGPAATRVACSRTATRSAGSKRSLSGNPTGERVTFAPMRSIAPAMNVIVPLSSSSTSRSEAAKATATSWSRSPS